MSGLFRGSLINWACLTKEAYAIYMSIKKVTYYLEDAYVTLRSDHLLLKKFLAKNTLNSKVNNWAIEISPFHITFEYIKGIKNTLANTMSQMIGIDPQIQPEPEHEGYEFGYYTFNPLPALEIHNIQASLEGSTQDDTANDHLGNLPIDNEMLTKLQQEDEFCKNILKQIEKDNIVDGQLYKIENNILKRFIMDGDDTHETTVIPRSLTPQVL